MLVRLGLSPSLDYLLHHDCRRQLSPAGVADRPRPARLQGAAGAHARNMAVENTFLEEAQDDATLLAIRDMERAGIDIITDGEMRRESYSNRFATALEGIDIERPGSTINRSGVPIPVPRVAGPIRRRAAGRSARCGVSEKEHFAADQNHPARPVHHGAAGAGRLLQGRGSARARFRRRGERGAARPQGGRRRRGAARRAVAAGAPRPRRALWSESDQPRAAGNSGNHRGARVLRLRRGGEGQADRLFGPAAARGAHARRRSRSRRRSPSSTWVC